MIKIGTSLIDSNKIIIGGTSIVSKVYVGANLVYGYEESGSAKLYIDNGIYPYVPGVIFKDLTVLNQLNQTIYVYIASQYFNWEQPVIPVPTYTATTIGEQISQTIKLTHSYSIANYNFSTSMSGYNDFITIGSNEQKVIRITKDSGDDIEWKAYLAYSTTPIYSPIYDNPNITVWTSAIGATPPRCYVVVVSGEYPYKGSGTTEVDIYNPTNQHVDIYGVAQLTESRWYGVEIIYESGGIVFEKQIAKSIGFNYNYCGFVNAYSSKRFLVTSIDVNSNLLINNFSDSSNGPFLEYVDNT